MDVVTYNRKAWDSQVASANKWTVPVSSEDIARAREGDWKVVLTPVKPVPADWFPPMDDLRVLGLASGGGQQCPLFAAAGARVTVFDNSPKQLGQDRLVAERDGLDMRFEQGDMADLSRFDDGSFDLVFHPVSNVFAAEVEPVWREAYRVLRPGGTLLAGISNPVMYIFDYEPTKRGELVVRHSLPYSDIGSLPEDERKRLFGDDPVEFGHTLDDQIGGQLRAGFALTGFFEDYWEDAEGETILAKYMPTFIATRAVKPPLG